ncbi:MAG: RNA methyltransferase [Pirellulales bacterium]
MESLKITSTHNPRIRAAAKLRQRGAREDEGQTLIDGWREIERAAASGVRLVAIFLPDNAPLDAGRRVWIKSLETQFGTQLYELTEGPYRRVAFGQHETGPVAIAETPRLTLDQLQLPDEPLIAVVEGVEKPGNLGAILRSADGAGVDAVIAVDPATDLYNPNVIRASLGTIFAVPVCAATADAARQWLARQVDRIVVTRVDGAADYHQTDYRGRCAIVLGSEAEGVTGTWRTGECVGVRIPMRGIADSLNVSAAAAILFYEAQRQREG